MNRIKYVKLDEHGVADYRVVQVGRYAGCPAKADDRMGRYGFVRLSRLPKRRRARALARIRSFPSLPGFVPGREKRPV